jgi:hypothetical protein
MLQFEGRGVSTVSLALCGLTRARKSAQQSVHRTAGGLRVVSLIQAKNLVPFPWLVLPAAGNAGR